MFWRKYKKRIEELELENKALAIQCSNLIKQLHQAEKAIMKIQELRMQEWTIDPSKTRKYN